MTLLASLKTLWVIECGLWEILSLSLNTPQLFCIPCLHTIESKNQQKLYTPLCYFCAFCTVDLFLAHEIAYTVFSQYEISMSYNSFYEHLYICDFLLSIIWPIHFTGQVKPTISYVYKTMVPLTYTLVF